MSPIGRTFIVLNLVLAGAFVGFAGTFLQKQHNWKEEHSKLNEEYTTAQATWDTDRERLSSTNEELRASLDSVEQNLQARDRELANEKDEVKRLRDENGSLAASFASLNSFAEASRQTLAEMTSQSQAAYQASIDAQSARDAAISEKDDAVAENGQLKNQIASLQEQGRNKDMQLASLEQNGREKDLLLDVARAKGFVDRMAVPMLAGTVSMVTGNLCTLMITDNPSNAEIKPGYTFAVYDQGGYKAEARVTKVDSDKGAAFCTFEIKNGDVKVGDKASTHLAGY